MSTTTNSGGIFTFDHGQKSLNKAIGVEQSYLIDLGEKIAESLKDFVFENDQSPKEQMSPSGLVEVCATEFSYSQLVIMSSFYLKDKIEGFAKKLEGKLDDVRDSVKSITLDADDVPDNIKKILDGLTGGKTKGTAIDGHTLPQELKDFLQKMAEEQDNDED